MRMTLPFGSPLNDQPAPHAARRIPHSAIRNVEVGDGV